MDNTNNRKPGKTCPTKSKKRVNESTPDIDINDSEPKQMRFLTSLDHLEDERRNSGVIASTSKTFPDEVNQSYNYLTEYDKEKGSAGSKGVDYQIGILTIFLINSLRTLKNWRLSTENKAAGKFDDVVLEKWEDGSNNDILVQCKYKLNKEEKFITLEDLLSTNSNNDNFSLIKYIKSYLDIRTKFQIKHLIICTNARVDETVMQFLEGRSIDSESMCFYGKEDKCKFYIFNNGIMKLLNDKIKKHNENIKKIKEKARKENRKIPEEINIPYETMADFFQCLQFYCNYPPGNNLDIVMEQLLSLCKFSTNTCIYVQTSASEIQNKVMDWFQRKDGVYLNETYGKSLICEIWRDRRWQTLEDYDVQFKKIDCNFPEEKRILHVNVSNEYLLQELRICSCLKNHETKMLLMSSDNKLEEQKQILEAFSWPDYKFLIVICPRITENYILKADRSTLKDILEKYKYKQVIFVTEEKELLQYLCLNSMYCTVREHSVRFEDFSDETQDRLLRKRNIIYQGEECSLENFLAKEDIEKVLSGYVLERLITNESIDVGVKPQDLNEDVSRFYIERKFEKKFNDGRVQTLAEEALYDECDKVILISDQAGTGKSTVLTKLALMIKSKYSDMWVIRIELSDYTKILRDVLDKNRDVIDILELLHSKDATKLRNRLEEDVFSLGGRVVLMLDGLDEISPDYTKLVINMIVKCLEAHNFGKIFVTTRPHMTQDLEEQLNVEAFNLYPFTKTDQTDFLTKYWLHNLKLDSSKTERCKEYADALLKSISCWVSSEELDVDHFAAIPLLIRMLAEIFQESRTTEVTDWQGCREYVAGTGTVPELPEEMDIVKLYEMFIEKKRLVFNQKKNRESIPIFSRSLKEKFEECLGYHRSLALEVFLNKSECNLFSDYLQRDEKLEIDVLEIGIVQKRDGQIYFIHRTFAEYFVAQTLLKELEKKNQNIEFQTLFIDRILLLVSFSNLVLAFLDSFLQNVVDDLPSSTFESYQSVTQRIQSHQKVKFFLIHLLAEEGCVSILKLLFKCIDLKAIRDQRIYITDVWETYLQEGVVGNTLSILKDLVQQGGVNIYDIHNVTVLGYAIKAGHLKMVKYLISQGANVNEFQQKGALFKAILHEHEKITTYLLEYILKNNVLYTRYFEIPYAAAYLGRLDILKPLVEQGLDINCTIEEGETLIVGAACGGRSEVMEYLVQQGADINKKDEDGDTVLHIISNTSVHVSTVELLVKLGLDLCATNNDGDSVLHTAAHVGNLNIVKMLIEDGTINGDGNKVRLDVNSVNKIGKTALHFATTHGYMDTVKILLQHGADINFQDGEGRTALHLAALANNTVLVEFLIQNKADQNIRDSKGRLALEFCSESDDYANDNEESFSEEEYIDSEVLD